MKIKFLKAFNGDSIWISFLENNNPRNILIDGGIGRTYRDQFKRPGELFQTIEEIKELGQNIDLLILTHFDDDHIGGILRWLNNDELAPTLIKNVWFNSGREIVKMLGLKEFKNIDIEIKEGEDDFYTSTKDGIKFEDYLTVNKLWDGKIIKQGEEKVIFGLKFKILSPSEEKLKDLVELYKEEEDYFTRGGEFDFETSLSDFCEEESKPNFKFNEDDSVPNGSSIAFIMEYNDKRFLFLGDAHPSVVIQGLKKVYIDETRPLNIELMKVSHHGSKRNTNTELLDLIKTDRYLISSNGSKHGLPNKRTIARIIRKNPNAIIHFNYESLKDEIFQKIDFETCKDFKISSTNEFKY